MQTLDILGFRCTFEVLETLFGVVVALAVEVERGEVVKCAGEILLGGFHVILEGFLLVGSQDLLLGVLVVEAIFIKVAHVSQRLKMTELAGLLPHRYVVIGLAIKPSFIQRSQPVNGLRVFLLPRLLIVKYRRL